MDYRAAYANDYQYDPNVVDGVFSFGPSREHNGATPTIPATVKVARADPSQKQTIQAASAGVAIESTDVMITLWAVTLSPTYAFGPKIGDVITLGSDRYIIATVALACWGTQFVMYSKASPRNVA